MNQAEPAPLVSIGLAVYNGEDYLEEAIRSILAQTYPHFELIISDNASTDRTAEICLRFAAQDARIRYSRNQTNIGGANNENLTVSYARGTYFRLAGHDDLLAPTYIEQCVAALERDPGVVLCHSKIVIIDEHGQELRTVSEDLASAPRPSARFRALTDLRHRCESTYGLMRIETLRATGLQRNYTDSDRTLLAHLSLYGTFYEIPEPLFYRRIHPKASTVLFADWRQRMGWFGDDAGSRITMPHWLQLLHYVEVISRGPVSPEEKVRCYLHMIEWTLSYRRWRRLSKDLILAGQTLSKRVLWRLSFQQPR